MVTRSLRSLGVMILATLAACGPLLGIVDPDGPLLFDAGDATSTVTDPTEPPPSPNDASTDAPRETGAPTVSLLWQDTGTGEVGAWNFRGGATVARRTLSWRCGPFNGCVRTWFPVDTTQRNSILWHNRGAMDPHDGELQEWLFDGTGNVSPSPTWSWQCTTSSGCASMWTPIGRVIAASGGVGSTSGLLWHNRSSGELSLWTMLATDVTGTLSMSKTCGAMDGCSQASTALLTADMNGDGQTDILWLNRTTGVLSIWLLDELKVTRTQPIARTLEAGARTPAAIAGVVDANGDGHADLGFFDAHRGEVTMWFLDGAGGVLGSSTIPLKCGDSCAAELQNVRTIGFVALGSR